MNQEYAYIGISGYELTNHDYSVAGIFRGKIYAIEVQRITKFKHFGVDSILSDTPGYIGLLKAIKYLIGVLGIPKGTTIKTRGHPSGFGVDGYLFKNDSILDHHLFHAWSTYYASDFSDSAILTIDYTGIKVIPDSYNTLICQSIFYGKGNRIELVSETIFNEEKKQFSIGYLYDLHSRFLDMEAGSLMGLSAYGDKEVFSALELYIYQDDFVYIHPSISSQLVSGDTKDNVFVLEKLYKTLPRRGKDKSFSITKTLYAHIAAKIQYETEQAILYLAKRAQEKTGSKNLCIAGGVGLNIMANSKIIEVGIFGNIFVQPAASDSGISLGAVLALYVEDTGKRFPINSYGLGRFYSEKVIEKNIDAFGDVIEVVKERNFQLLASEIASGKIVAWFTGRSEFGPRALGNRSILGDPRQIEIRDRVNTIKSRELWRPLAPIVLETEKDVYFSFSKQSPYMTYASLVYQNQEEKIPAVIHVDKTARYQTLNYENNPELYELLREFFSQTQVPILINTSLNVAGQPIIESPSDAIKLFLSTDIDILYLQGYVVRKSKSYPQYIFSHEISLNKHMQLVKLYILFFQDISTEIERICNLYFPGSQTKLIPFVSNTFHLIFGDKKYSFMLSSCEFVGEDIPSIVKDTIYLIILSSDTPEFIQNTFSNILDKEYSSFARILKKIQLLESKYFF